MAKLITEGLIPKESQQRHGPVVEQFRFLRTHIEMRGPCSVMMTSALDQEGKTLCTVNLAIALSLMMDAGVIVLDADLRKPSLAARFGIRAERGLTDYLEGRAEWRDCLAETEYENIVLFPGGRPCVNAPELLDSQRLVGLKKELSEAYPKHYLLWDAPPLLLVADALVLARRMEHVIMVIRAGYTPRPAVLKAVESLGRERILGVVLNDVTAQLSQYYQYGRSYSAYSYSYPARPKKAG